MPPTEENVYEVEEMLNQPGTYFNPQTEVVVIVDDSASADQEVFNNLEGLEGADEGAVVRAAETRHDRVGVEAEHAGDRARREGGGQ